MQKLTTHLFMVGILLLSVCPVSAQDNQNIMIYGLIRPLKYEPGDSIRISFSELLLHKGAKIPAPRETWLKLEYAGFESMGDQYFRYELKGIARPGYLTIGNGPNNWLYMYLTEPGDSIKIKIDQRQNHILFGGPAADKFRCQYEMRMAAASKQLNQHTIMFTPSKIGDFNNDTAAMARFDAKNSLFGKQLEFVETDDRKDFERLKTLLDMQWETTAEGEVLQAYRERIGYRCFEILRADIIGEKGSSFYTSLQTYLNNLKYRKNETLDSVYRKLVRGRVLALPETHHLAPEHAVLSVHYLEFRSRLLRLEAWVAGKSVADVFLEKEPGILRDHIAGSIFLSNYGNIKGGEAQLKAILQSISDPDIAGLLQEVHQRISKGAVFPDAPFMDRHNKPVSLTSLKDKVVLVDFWFTGCSACSGFYKYAISKVEEHFKDNKDFVVVTVSIDKNLKTWQKSVAGGEYTSDLAINLYTGGEGGDHPVIRHYNIIGYPHQLLIGRNNRLYQSDNLRLPPEALIALIEKVLDDKKQ